MHPIRIAVLIGIVFSNAAWAGDDLGRLLLTPEQRRALDERRGANAQPAAADADNSPLAEQAANSTIRLNGVVSRSDGPDVVWVNGNRTDADQNPLMQLLQGPDRRNRVTLESSRGNRVRLKPGQVWDPATGRVTDCFGCETGAASKSASSAATAPDAGP